MRPPHPGGPGGSGPGWGPPQPEGPDLAGVLQHHGVIRWALLVGSSMDCATPCPLVSMPCAVAGCYKTALVVHLGLVLAHQLLLLAVLTLQGRKLRGISEVYGPGDPKRGSVKCESVWVWLVIYEV